MAKYRKKPVEIEACQLPPNGQDATEFLAWLRDQGLSNFTANMDGTITVHTLEGDMRADLGDWIIRGVKGEFYPCKPDIFGATYDPVP